MIRNLRWKQLVEDGNVRGRKMVKRRGQMNAFSVWSCALLVDVGYLELQDPP